MCVCVCGCSCQKVFFNCLFHSIASHINSSTVRNSLALIIKQHDEINGTQYDRNYRLFIEVHLISKRERNQKHTHKPHRFLFYHVFGWHHRLVWCISKHYFFSQISFSMAKERFLCKSIWSFAKLKFWFIFLFVEFVQLISSPHISWHIFE